MHLRRELQVSTHTFAEGGCVLVLLEAVCTHIYQKQMCQLALAGRPTFAYF